MTYYGHARKNCFLSALANQIEMASVNQQQLDEFMYLAHFTKRVFKQPSARPKATTKRPVAKKPAKKKAAPKTPDPFTRSFGKTMSFLEEREWRVVEHPELVSNDILKRNGLSLLPKYFLPYVTGTELYTLVLPDNQTVSQVLSDSWLRKQLYPSDRPHVTVLSLQDIGTF